MPDDKCRHINLSKPSTLLTSKDMALKAERHLSQGSLTTLLDALPFWTFERRTSTGYKNPGERFLSDTLLSRTVNSANFRIGWTYALPRHWCCLQNGLQLDDDVPHTRTSIYWEAWASQKIWILWEAMILSILNLDSMRFIPCVSPRFRSCPIIKGSPQVSQCTSFRSC